MPKIRLVLIMVVISVMAFYQSATCELISVYKRWVVDRSAIAIDFYQDQGKITVQVRVPMGKMEQYDTVFSCSDKWDWNKVDSASKSAAKLFNSNSSITHESFINSLGLSDCVVKAKK